MAFALIIIGVVMLIAAARGTTDGPTGLWGLLLNDFSGANNFIFWMAAILVIGAVGYIPKLKPVSTALLGLVVLVLFLVKGNPGATAGGFFSQFTSALQATTATPSQASTVISANSTALPNGVVNTTPVSPTPTNSLPTLPTLNGFVN